MLLLSQWLVRSLSISHMVAEHEFRDKFSKPNSDIFVFCSVLRWPRSFFWSDIGFVYIMALGKIDKSPAEGVK